MDSQEYKTSLAYKGGLRPTWTTYIRISFKKPSKKNLVSTHINIIEDIDIMGEIWEHFNTFTKIVRKKIIVLKNYKTFNRIGIEGTLPNTFMDIGHLREISKVCHSSF